VAKFVKGDIVVIPFPFSDLTKTKRRPALVVSSLEGNDVILCQITSQSIKDKYAVQIKDKDFESGELKQKSNVRPNRIFTADSRIVLYKAARLKVDKLNMIIEGIVEIIRK
jgi:mRNA interferase MazF